MVLLLTFTVALFAVIYLLIVSLRLTLNLIAQKRKDPVVSNPMQKKYAGVELRQYYPSFLLIGFVFSLGITIIAFSWTTYESLNKSIETEFFWADEEVEIEIISSTLYKAPPPPLPAPPIYRPVEVDPPTKEEKQKDPDEKVIDEFPFAIGPDLGIPDEIEPVEPPLVYMADVMPEFPGGKDALNRYLAGAHYPRFAQLNDIEGTVFITFVIDEHGNTMSVYVERGVHPLLDNAAVAHLQRMPQWSAGEQNGRPVRVRFTVPIRFKLY